jgi:hypothetical protein
MINQKKPSKLAAALAGCYIIFMVLSTALIITVLCFWGAKASLAILDPEDPIKKLETAIDALPDSPLKRNLYTILASEYASDSEELNEILQAYSQMKIQELQNGKSL